MDKNNKPLWMMWIDDTLANQALGRKRDYIEDACDDILAWKWASKREINKYLVSLGEESVFLED